MSARLFGTDGIRGRAGRSPLTVGEVLRLGEAVGRHFPAAAGRAPVVIGRDTRRSGGALEGALAAGLAAAGVDSILVGVLPTPGIAHLTRDLGARAGFVVSASHNPFDDNGIKIFGPDGFKLEDAEEDAIEAGLRAPPAPSAEGLAFGEVRREDLAASYVEALVGAAGPGLGGLRIVFDGAHGACAALGPQVLREAGAVVTPVGCEPDGININAGCGALHPEGLATRVVEAGAALGVAVDGDGDRCVLVDETGQVRDGDAVLGVLAVDLAARGELPGGAVVATSMSNLGLEVFLRARGIDLVRADVGDRYVVQELRRRGLRLGGEQSGHLVDLARGTTGDGLLTAIAVSRIMAASGRPLSVLCDGLLRFPQVLHNVRVRQRVPIERLPSVMDAIDLARARLGARGRVVVRYSGTEPKARVMIEGPEGLDIDGLARSITNAFSREIGDG